MSYGEFPAALATAEDVVDQALPDTGEGVPGVLLAGASLVDEFQLDAVDTHTLNLAQRGRGDGLRIRGDDANPRAGDWSVNLLGGVLCGEVIWQQRDAGVEGVLGGRLPGEGYHRMVDGGNVRFP